MRLYLVGWLVLSLWTSATAFVAPFRITERLLRGSSVLSALPDDLGLPSDLPTDAVSDKVSNIAGKAAPSMAEYLSRPKGLDTLVSPSTTAESQAKLALLKQNTEAFVSSISSVNLENAVSYAVSTLQLEAYGPWYAAAFFLFLAAAQRQAGRDEAKAELVENIVKGKLDVDQMVQEIKEAEEAEAKAQAEREAVIRMRQEAEAEAKAEKEAEIRKREEEAAARREAAAKVKADALAKKKAEFEEARQKREAAKQAVLEERQRLQAAKRAEVEEKRRLREEAIRAKQLEAAEKKLALQNARLKKEEERRLAAEEKRLLAEEKKLAAAEARRKAVEEKRQKLEEQKLAAAEARRLQVEEKTAAIEAKRKQAEEKRKKAEAKKLADIEDKLQQVEEEKKAVSQAKNLKAELEAAVAEAKQKDAKVEAVAEKKPKTAKKKAKGARKGAKKATKKASTKSEPSVNASPLAKVLARENGIDIESVPGTGSRGKVLADDVRNFLRSSTSSAPADEPSADEEVSDEFFFANPDGEIGEIELEVVTPKVSKSNSRKSAEKPKGDWASLAPSTLKRKTVKQLSEYLVERGAAVTDSTGTPLKKADLVQAVLELSQ